MPHTDQRGGGGKGAGRGAGRPNVAPPPPATPGPATYAGGGEGGPAAAAEQLHEAFSLGLSLGARTGVTGGAPASSTAPAVVQGTPVFAPQPEEEAEGAGGSVGTGYAAGGAWRTAVRFLARGSDHGNPQGAVSVQPPPFPPPESSSGKRYYGVRVAPPAVGVYCGWNAFYTACIYSGAATEDRQGDYRGFKTLEPCVRWVIEGCPELAQVPIVRVALP